MSKKSSSMYEAFYRFSALLLLTLLIAGGCANNAQYVALEDIPGRASSAPAPSNSQPVRPRPSATESATSANRNAQSTAPNQSSSTRAEVRPQSYVVQRGDTLYSISFRYNLDFRRVAAANGINEPFTIVPGQVIRLIDDAPQTTITAAPTPPAPRVVEPTSPRQNVVTPPPSTSASSPAPSNWLWPVDGNIVRTFSDTPSGSKGIDISAAIGDSVRAAADGRVVYAGDGLRGYGNLIILEHAGRILSAYAFASVINVTEQQEVKQGDIIAAVGSRGDESLLHFEIRRDGRPVDPLTFLPRK
ncbi:peptidoglycan DD-metalloendopeptidase family protein [Salinispirillum marinum]|uniref:Peptidoglycan DD-metalloendopeptidase family protein n=2 Tax=Saccharospirillaceae TaxID=255527 RepID=A0ABV8BGM4_9GAMM